MANPFLRTSVFSILWLAVPEFSPAADAPHKAVPSPDSPTFGDFSERAAQYLKLRKALPHLRTTKSQEQIVDRRHALAEAIRESRSGAKPGDIFTPEISQQFLRVIRGTLRGPGAANVRKTVRQGEPLGDAHLTVNGAYPEHLPLTTVPPTLLLRLPLLPEKLAYRIVGHDFVLEDTEARLVVDLIPEQFLKFMPMRRLAFAFLLVWSALNLPLRAQDITLPLKSGSVRFAAIGDMGTGDPAQYDVAKRMLEFHQKFPFDFVIMLGDNVYGGKSPADLQKKFEVPYKPLLDAGVQFYASLGNHDDPNERFYKLFNMGGQQYYSFKKGNVRFFALDSDYLDPKELAWLEKELANSGTGWKICFFHHPLYSSGAFHGSSTELRLVLEPLFLKYGVQVVFAGHEHVYERIKPQKGIYYFTEGASGELRAGNLKKTELTAVGYDKDRSFLSIEISGDDLYFQAVSRTGVTVDSGILRRPAEVRSDARNTSAGSP